MSKIYSIILPFIFFSYAGETDCNTVFECKPVNSEKAATYSLEIKLKEGNSGDYTFELYDLNAGETVTTINSFFSAGEKKVIFNGVKPSTYTIVFHSSNCKTKKAIPGKGITLQ